MAIACSQCEYQMSKKSATFYFQKELYEIAKLLYEYYQKHYRGWVDSGFCFFLNQKQVICPNCLKYCGWIVEEKQDDQATGAIIKKEFDEDGKGI